MDNCVACKKKIAKGFWLEWKDRVGNLVGGIFCLDCFEKRKVQNTNGN